MKTSFSDTKNFISRLTAKKIINYFRLWHTYNLSVLTRNYSHAGLPASLAIELTNECNLSCPGCPVGMGSLSRDRGAMNFSLFRKIVDESSPELVYLMLYFMGEPYLNTDIFNMISYADKKNIYTSLSTNAQLINDEYARKTIEAGLSRIIISLDGTSQEVYEKYRKGGSLEKVTGATENLLKWREQLGKTYPFIVHQFLITGRNEHQIKDFFRFSKQTGADAAEIKTVQITDFEKQKFLLSSDDKYSRYIKNPSGSIERKDKIRNRCFRSWSSAVVTWDGLVIPCCFDKDARHVSGNISNHTLAGIFSGERVHGFRKKILNNRADISICTNCTE